MTEDEVLEIAEANLKNLHADLQRLIDISRIMGRRAERERIIELISTGKLVTGDQAFFLIEAIKGEQK